MRKISKQFNGERIVFSTDDVETTGHPYTHTHTHTVSFNLYFPPYVKK